MATNHFSCGRRRLLLAAGAGALLVPLAACGGSRSVPVDIVGTAATAVPPPPAPIAASPTSPAVATAALPAPPPAATAGGSVRLVPLTAAEESKVEQWQRQGWQTNFAIKSVDLREIR